MKLPKRKSKSGLVSPSPRSELESLLAGMAGQLKDLYELSDKFGQALRRGNCWNNVQEVPLKENQTYIIRRVHGANPDTACLAEWETTGWNVLLGHCPVSTSSGATIEVWSEIKHVNH
jgi:hypothetical protein